MVLKVNKDLEDFILNSDYDDNMKDFLIQALRLEFEREKEDARNYFKTYDALIERYVK